MCFAGCKFYSIVVNVRRVVPIVSRVVLNARVLKSVLK